MQTLTENDFLARVTNLACVLAANNANSCESLNKLLTQGYRAFGEEKMQALWDIAYESLAETNVTYKEYIDKMTGFGLLKFYN